MHSIVHAHNRWQYRELKTWAHLLTGYTFHSHQAKVKVEYLRSHYVCKVKPHLVCRPWNEWKIACLIFEVKRVSIAEVIYYKCLEQRCLFFFISNISRTGKHILQFSYYKFEMDMSTVESAISTGCYRYALNIKY